MAHLRVVRRTKTLHYDRIVTRMNLNIDHKTLRLPSKYNVIEPDGSIANVRIIAKHKIDKISILGCSNTLEFPGNGTNNILFILPERWIPANIMIDIYPHGEFIIQYDYVHHNCIDESCVLLPCNKILVTEIYPLKHLVRYKKDSNMIISAKV